MDPDAREAPMTSGLFLLSGTVKHDPAIERWFDEQPEELGAIARGWFALMRACGDDVREVLHDDHPTACVGDAAFAYVDAFTAHVNVGFFNGARLDDPAGLLEGTGKMMRHVKVRPAAPAPESAIHALIRSAYWDIKRRA